MNILITGAAGFLGHHVVEHILRTTDNTITILDRLSYAGNLNRIADMDVYKQNGDRVEFVWHDLRAPISSPISRQIKKPELILHLAAESHVDRSLVDSIPFIHSNVLGTAHLLEWIRKTVPLAKTIIFSTDEVFGAAPEGVSFLEDAPFRPSNPYAASKAGEEMIAYSFAHAYKLPILIARSMNIFGERQHLEKFIPKTIHKISLDENITLHGRNKEDISSRCWIHARNVADALMFLSEKGNPGEMYHIAGEEKTVWEMANIISLTLRKKKLEEQQIEYIDFHNARPGHDKRYALSGSKMRAMGWTPPVNIETALRRVVEWEKLHPKWFFLG